MKRLFYVLMVCLVVLSAHKGKAGGYQHFVEYQGKKLEYAYYVPETVTATPNALILVPWLNGRGDQMIDEAWIRLSDKTGRPIIAPSFVFEGEKAFQNKESYQYPAVWSGGALNAIFSQFAEKGIHIQRLYMAGFSAGAQFVERYALAHPEQVAKCAIGASGGNDPIDYVSPVQFFYAIGENDQDNRRQFAEEFERQAEAYGVSVKRNIYKGVGHSFTADMKADFIQFLTED
ncbi:MAG: dienelactone hydrolase family protein [Pseudomonadota bacterium]|nr:dienelactone hydrolase family protein [Pseudomonadota bacterium]